jgi:RNA polymerase sigma factor (sigma-70 family)
MESELNKEIQLIEKAKSGDNDSMLELIKKHSGICVEVYKKYIGLPNISGFISEDIISSKDYVIFNSVKTYDPSHGSKFSTWLANQMRYYCLNTINKSSKLVPTEDSLLINIIEKNTQESSPARIEELKDKKNEALEMVKQTLENLKNKKIKQCVQKIYFSEDDVKKTYTQVAKEMNVTVQTVINWHNKFLKLIKNKYNSKQNLTTKQ